MLAAQPPAAFDVTLIKPADLTNPQRGIQRIYAIQEFQVAGGPPWMDSDRFDVAAKVETDTPPSTDQLWLMLQRLLADRFALKFHRETKMRQGYALIPGKTGRRISSD